MKRWRKYVVCLTCICCLGLLTGCGNDMVTETEQMTEKKDDPDNVNHVTEPGTDTDRFTEEEQTNTLTDDRADQLNGDVTDDTTDDSNAAENIGDAGADIVDGVGDAGKDVIDGVENAADSLTGNIDDPVENRAE